MSKHTLANPRFTWDTYTKAAAFPYGEGEAHTARGWAKLTNHPDMAANNGRFAEYIASSGYNCVGNYLDYERSEYTIHAVAYFQAFDGHNVSTISLGSECFDTTEEAQAWIETRVRQYLGQPALVPAA